MLDLIKISRCLESYDYVMAIKIRMELKFQVKILQKKKANEGQEGRWSALQGKAQMSSMGGYNACGSFGRIHDFKIYLLEITLFLSVQIRHRDFVYKIQSLHSRI